MCLLILSMVVVLIFDILVSVLANRAFTYYYIFEIKYKKPNINLFEYLPKKNKWCEILILLEYFYHHRPCDNLLYVYSRPK